MEIRKSHLDDVQRIMTLIHQAQNILNNKILINGRWLSSIFRYY